MRSVQLDTHSLHWLAAEPERLSEAALATIEAADELVVSGISWWELAWLAHPAARRRHLVSTAHPRGPTGRARPRKPPPRGEP